MEQTQSDELEYGAVYVKSGRYKGRIGYYDNDEWCSKGMRAVVYFDQPFMGPWYMVKYEHLENIVSLEHERFKNENPEFCAVMGIP